MKPWKQEPMNQMIFWCLILPLWAAGSISVNALWIQFSPYLLDPSLRAFLVALLFGGAWGVAIFIAHYAATGKRRKQLRITLQEVKIGNRCAWSFAEFEVGDKKHSYGTAFICEEAPKSLRN